MTEGRDGAVVAILGTRYPDFSIEERVLAPLGARIVSGAGSSSEAISETAARADVILAGSGPRFDETILASLSCKGIVRYGVGTEAIDLAAAARRGIWVANVPDYGTEAVAVHTVALVLAAIRRIPQRDAAVKAGGWGFTHARPLHLPSVMTAGVIGFGRIGREVARLLAEAGFSVLAYDPMAEVRPDHASIRDASFADILDRSDVVSLHAPGDPSGAPLIGRDEIAAMKQDSVLVNTARGSLVDLDALVAGLQVARPAIAALDVYPSEPPDVSIFAGIEDCLILTPHMAWYTEESETRLREIAAQEALRILTGHSPVNVVATPQETRA